MGQLTNLYVSESYQGLLKMTNSTTGVTGTLQTVQTGDGTNSPLQISQTQVNISGSLTVNGSPITNVNTGSFVTTSSFNAYTSSMDTRVDGIEAKTGSYATTGSNIFIGDQTITGSLYSTDIVGTGSLFLQPNQSDARFVEVYNTSPTDTHITASGGQIFLGDDVTYVKVDNYGSVERIDVVAGNELNVSSSVVNVTSSLHQSGTFYPDVIDWINSSITQETGSYVLTTDTSGITHYDTYQNVASALQPFINTGSFNRDGLITTGSVGGSQSITGSLNVSGTLTATSASITYLETVYETASVIYSSGSNQFGDASNDTQTLYGTVNLPNGPLVVTGSVTSSAGFNGNLTGTASYATNANSASFAPTVIPDWVATTGSNVFKGFQQILNDLEIKSSNPVGTFVNMVSTGTTSFLMNSPLTQFQSNGEMLFTNTLSSTGSSDINFRTQNGGDITFNTSNSGSVAVTGSFNTTGSFNLINTNNLGNNTISSVGPSAFNTLNLISNNLNLSATVGGGVTIDASQTRNTGSFRSKGFVEIRSGSLFTISEGTTVNINSYLTSSDAGQSNIIKGWGDNPSAGGAGAVQANYTGSLRITGSNNMVSMPQLRATGLGGGADQQGYISGSDNTLQGNLAGIFLNTGSLLFPKTTNNFIGYNSNISMNFTTSSLAGGHPLIQNNTLYAGQLAINSNSGSINVNGNLLNGGVITSTQNFTTNVRPAISTNTLIGSTTNLNHISSSIQYTSNISNANFSVTNALSSSIVNNVLGIGNNTFLGTAGNTPHTIFVSGSQSSNVARTINNNLIGGQSIIVSSSFVSSSAANLNSSIIYGSNLAVSASHVSLGGSAFFGRFNATGSNQEDAQSVVFAVGTGTGAGGRKTGFLIDSGSVTRISGSLSVQGGSSLTGSLNVSASLNAVVVSGSANITHNIAGQPALTLVNSTGTNQPGLIVSGTLNVTSTGDHYVVGNSTNIQGPFKVNGDTNITGSITVSNLPAATGSFIVTTDTNGILTKSEFNQVAKNFFSAAEFGQTGTLTAASGVSGSVPFNISGSVYGITLVSGSQITVQNAGTYNIQFSAQWDCSGGADTGYMWFKKNGSNITDSATKVKMNNNTSQVMTVNILDEASPNNYYEVVWQNTGGHAQLLGETSSGNVPGIPSVITTITQVR